MNSPPICMWVLLSNVLRNITAVTRSIDDKHRLMNILCIITSLCIGHIAKVRQDLTSKALTTVSYSYIGIVSVRFQSYAKCVLCVRPLGNPHVRSPSNIPSHTCFLSIHPEITLIPKIYQQPPLQSHRAASIEQNDHYTCCGEEKLSVCDMFYIVTNVFIYFQFEPVCGIL